MIKRRRNTPTVVSVCLIQLCFVLVESLILVVPSMYVSGYLLDNAPINVPINPRYLGLFFFVVMAGVFAFPVFGTLSAWFLLSSGRYFGWYLAAAVDVILASAFASLAWALYTSPPSSGHTTWGLLLALIALPVTHLAVITMPPVRGRLIPGIASANFPLTQTF